MRVKCIDNAKKLPNITLNKNYSVYEYEFLYEDGVKQYSCFRIQDDYGSIIPYSARYFKIISNYTRNYIEKKVAENKYIVTCNQINYEGFWSQLYDDKVRALDDFWKSKKEIYKLELTEDEFIQKITEDNEYERDCVITYLIEEKNECAIEQCIELCKNKLNAWGNINELEIIFEYLSIFKRDNIDKFFIEYLAESEKGNKKIDRIVDEYYNNVFE